MKNKEIAEIFERIATYLEIKGENIFKIKAYQRAAENILTLGEDIAQIQKDNRLSTIPGVGEALQVKITEYLETGKISAYENLKKEIPETILDIVQIPSIGPKKAKLFFDHLHVKSVAELEAAIQSKKILGLPGIQEKTIENILRGIRLVKQGQERMNLGRAYAIAEQFVSQLKKMKKVKRVSFAGSLRRMKETIRDVDILVDSSAPQKVIDSFVALPQVKSINAQGDTKASILTHEGIQVDLRVVESRSYGAALLYFTGSKNFNVKIRQIAIKKDMKINEYGVFSMKGEKEKFLAGKTEKEVLSILNLPDIPPELREDIGEMELFSVRKIPKLVELSDIKGDLHAHSVWSDGRNTISEMAKAAQQKGYEYIAITDHSPRLKIAGGVSVENLKKKRAEIEKLNKGFKNFHILFGTEVEIDSNGNLDYNEKVLSEFDIVIAAIHSGFEQSRKQLTERITKACQNKHVHIIAHPTGVHIGKREPYDVDFKEICKTAAQTNTYLEINAFPIRLDLHSANVYFARSQNVPFSVNTDAHAIDHLDFMKFGVAVARRGWLEKKHILNTLSLAELIKRLKK